MAKVKGVKYWKKQTWDIFSRYIRARDAKRYMDEWGDKAEMGVAPCFTCGKLYPVAGKGCGQAGHFIPGRKGLTLFDERGVHFQCHNCNFRLKGNWAAYYDHMKKQYGMELIDELMHQRYETHKYTVAELEDMYNTYVIKLNELEEICPHWTQGGR